MKTSKKRLLVLFFSVLVLVACSDIFIYWVGRNALASQQKIVSGTSSRLHLEELLSTLKDAETGQRGYLLTGQESYLEPYREAVARFEIEFTELRRLSAARELPIDRVDAIGRFSHEKLAELAETIRLRREKGLDVALGMVNSDRGRKLMESIRQEIAEVKAINQMQLDKSVELAAMATVWRDLTFVSMGLLNLIFLAWAFRRISHEMDSRDDARLDATRQKETLATTLECIGDGVIATDAAGKVTFLNAEAARLSGWKNSEAQGQPLPIVFPIFNEETRLAVENPVEKVLRSGIVVGLANHTFLRSKDGNETPIDDSAAPIRTADGILTGVVLVRIPTAVGQ